MLIFDPVSGKVEAFQIITIFLWVDTRDARGSLFLLQAGRGRAEEKKIGVGRGGVTVKIGAFSGWGSAGQS